MKKLMDFLAGLKMTIISGVFLAISFNFNANRNRIVC